VAIDALELAFSSAGEAYGCPERLTLDVPHGELMLMPAFTAQLGVGVKLVTLTPENPGRGAPFIHGIYALFAPETQRPEALLDGTTLTAIRTAAVSGLATRWLARPDVRQLTIFGAGAQAAAHVDAMLAARPSIERIDIVGRDPGRVAALVADLAERGIEATASEPEVVRTADLVCTCTTATAPLFPGDWIGPGTHVNAVGAYRSDRRELDGELMGRATVVVEQREAALLEAGEIALAIGEGRFAATAIAGELGDVVDGRLARERSDQVTVFKSVGLALEDLVVARAAIDAAGEARPT
jgi:ornithine cyclodeaminase